MLVMAPVVEADDDLTTQIWANITTGWILSDSLYVELDVEPKILVSGDPKWRNIDATGLVEYYPNGWIDLTGEMTLGTTLQTDDLRTTELTFRGGVRFHFKKNTLDRVELLRKPLGRLSVATLVRLEHRRFWYSDSSDRQQDSRLRLRIELKVPLNGPDLAEDGTLFLIADTEGYVPLADEVDERFANKLRGRMGLGYRIDAHHRVDLLYILDRVQDNIEDDPTSSSQAFDIRYRMTF
jgi:hypothetical protein